MGLFSFIENPEELIEIKAKLNEGLKNCKTVEDVENFKKNFLIASLSNLKLSKDEKLKILDEVDTECKRKIIQLEI